jgi:NADPH:quinone reductase-like Zn-dependent oxidoreductase
LCPVDQHGHRAPNGRIDEVRVIEIDHPGGIEVLQLRERPAPTPAPGEVAIQFVASSINPADVKIRSGAVTPRVGAFPHVLGYDLVGKILASGAGAGAHPMGALVLAMSAMAVTGRGAWADVVCLRETSVALLPEALEPLRAARLPLVGLTALQAVERLDVDKGDEVLVVGALGSVGRVAVELLRHRGAIVQSIVRTPAQVEEALHLGGGRAHVGVAPSHSVAAVLDAAGGDFSEALADDGIYVSVVPDRVPDRDALTARGITRTIVLAEESGDMLTDLAKLAASGKLTLPLGSVHPFEDISSAHKEYEQHGQQHVVIAR